MAVRLEGPLSKWTNVVKGWQYRWFVLDENSGLLSYYTSKSKMMRGTRRGCLRLRNAQIGIDDEDDSTFTISSDQKTFHFQARDAIERGQWVKALEDTIRRHSRSKDIPNCFTVATEEEVNHRLAEAGSYFRILTQQVKNLEEQIESSPNAKCERLTLLKESMLKMIEAIGQVLEILHTAKSSLARKVPVPVLQGSLPEQQLAETKDDAHPKEHIQSTSTNGDVADSPLVSSVEETCQDGAGSDLSKSPRSDKHRLGVPLETVPCVSFSSSEDEDNDMEFFDANEYNDYLSEEECQLSISVTSDSPYMTPSSPKVEDSFSVSSQQSGRLPRKQSDSFFDDDDAQDAAGEEDTSVAGHGSVITHLLSQVKIGMDLTKVTLPTFILERRSLLEMYADFFAHPDLFANIPDLQTPEERMIQVLRWYLSSFHAGRKGSVAKKPYNPILGEIFECLYELPESVIAPSTEKATSGPLPWAKTCDVSFVAEQVSHHPPISALYAECFDKRVSFNSHIWTKSKFLGLSIGVHMVGQGNCYVMDWDEEYVMTFPNGYGRSILTVPWVEMGGQTEITCAKTGYSTKIDFHTKPFYGGKKHRLTAEVFAPGERKPIMSVHGEWNGVMYATTPGEKDPVVFVDTFNMPTIKKRVRVIERQEQHESRRLWQDVTHSLIDNRIDDATAAKHKLEEKQRADARERKETDTKWINRIFYESGERWLYKTPLQDRLNST